MLNSKNMKRILIFLAVAMMFFSLNACTIRSDKKLSDEEIEAMKEEYEEYLSETYPDETFTVEIWQEYGKKGGAAGLPDYEGYLIRQVVTDSQGRRFKVFTSDEGGIRRYSDDYEAVKDGRAHYNEKGQFVHIDEKGNIQYILSD